MPEIAEQVTEENARYKIEPIWHESLLQWVYAIVDRNSSNGEWIRIAVNSDGPDGKWCYTAFEALDYYYRMKASEKLQQSKPATIYLP